MKNKIINLHTHSQYSLLDGLNTPEQIVQATIGHGVGAAAITDHGNMNNFGNFYKVAKANKIKPIFGCEFYTVPDLETWKRDHEKLSAGETKNPKDERKRLSKNNHLILLAKNERGFRNINRLLNESYKNFYNKPRIDHALIEKHHEGVVCSTACIMGEVQQHILNDRIREAEKSADFFRGIFKKDFYFEIQLNEMGQQANSNIEMVDLAKKMRIKVILTGDAHYLELDNQKTHQTLLLLNSKKTYKDLKEGNAWEFDTKELFFKNYPDYLRDFKVWGKGIARSDFEAACENTFEVEGKIEDFKLDTSVKMKDAFPQVKDKLKFLTGLCMKSLKEKKLGLAYAKRLNFEIKVIGEKKLEDYFLIVWKIVSESKKKMLVGCGRGSGAGSLVNYLLGITEIDPIKYGLYFERFLSIDRADMPDIDVDFEHNDEVKNDLIKEYGDDVAAISNYSTFQVYGLIKDLGRVYNIENPVYFDILTKKIRMELSQNVEETEEGNINISYDEALKYSKTLSDFVKKYPEISYDLKILFGKIRHIGKHAAGMIICDDLIESQPTVIMDGATQTSLTEGVKERTLNEFGFVKIDILGLKTLQIFHLCLDYIIRGRKIRFDEAYNKLIHPDRMKLNDPKVYDFVFKKMNISGVFQLETEKIRQMILKTQPDCFEDLYAVNALFRPGPLKSGVAFEYGDRKRGEIEITYYENPIIKQVLGPTYGIMIYQEQIMELAYHLAGFTMAETNVLRKLLVKSKQIDEEGKKKLKKMKEQFFQGCSKHGMEEIKVEVLWDNMVAFSGYGFNKAHAVSYAMIAYQCAWLKTYYPREFYTALLNVEVSDSYGRIINEARSNKIDVMPVDINNSDSDFAVKNGKIYWGLSRLNGVGDKAADSIIQSREKEEFMGLKDFLLRKDINWTVCNKRVIDILIRIGAFDFGQERRKLLLKILSEWNAQKSTAKFSKLDLDEREQILSDLLGKYKKDRALGAMTKEERAADETAIYKFNLEFSPFVLKGRAAKIVKLKEKAGGFKDGLEFVLCEFVDIKRFKDKNGHDMAFLSLVDVNGHREPGIIFSSVYEEDLVAEGRVYCVKGQLQDKMIIDKYIDIDTIFKGDGKK